MPAIERLPGDTAKSYAALCEYAAIGPARSLERYRQSTGRSPGFLRQLERWSSAGRWALRCQAYDQQAQAELEQQRSALRAARRAELEDRDWQQGQQLRDAVLSLLAEVPRFLRRTVNKVEQGGKEIEVITVALATGPGELARALKLASDLQRLSVGEPTEIHKLVESELRATLDLLETSLSPEEFARVVAIIAGS